MAHRDIKYWFSHALIQADLNYRTFGQTLTPPVSHVTISRVLKGDSKSPRVEDAILEFIRAKLPLIHKRLDNLKRVAHPLYTDKLN